MSDDLSKQLRAARESGDPWGAWHLALQAADRIEQLTRSSEGWKEIADEYFDAIGERNTRIEKLEAVTKDDTRWLAAYHKWCEMNGCAPSSSDLVAARKALEGKND